MLIKPLIRNFIPPMQFSYRFISQLTAKEPPHAYMCAVPFLANEIFLDIKINCIRFGMYNFLEVFLAEKNCIDFR